MTDDAKHPRLGRRLLVTRATLGLGAGVALAGGAAAQSGRSDNDPNDAPGRGRSGRTDNDPSDGAGRGRR